MTELSDKVLLELRGCGRAIIQSYLTHHPIHIKKNIDTNPLNVQFIPRLKEAGEFLHNKVKQKKKESFAS